MPEVEEKVAEAKVNLERWLREASKKLKEADEILTKIGNEFDVQITRTKREFESIHAHVKRVIRRLNKYMYRA